MVKVACLSGEAFVYFFCEYSKWFLRCESTILVIVMGNGVIPSRDSLARVSWHFMVNLGTGGTTVIKHPRHRKG